MVNLKEFLLEASGSETRFLDSLPSFFKYVKRDDADFISKSATAIREILREKGATSTQKYFCLQLINLGVQSNSTRFIENVAEKLLERLYLLAMFDNKNEDLEARGKKLLRQFDDSADEEGSLKFFQLLLECFAHWGTEPGSRVSSFAAKHLALSKNVKLPTSFQYLNLYSSKIESHSNSSPPDQKSSKPEPTPQNKSGSDQIATLLEKLERISNGSSPDAEKQAKETLFQLQEAMKQFELSGLPSSPSTMSANRILEGVSGYKGSPLSFLKEKFGSSTRNNPFFGSVEEPLQKKKDESTSPEDIQTLMNYIEVERSTLLRKVATLEQENTKIREEKRRIEVKLAAFEVELRDKDRKIATLEDELNGKNETFEKYVREGLSFFRKSNNTPSLSERPPPRYETNSMLSTTSSVPRNYLENKVSEPPRIQSAHIRSHQLEDLGRPPISKDTSHELMSLKSNLAKADDFVMNFNADIASLLNRHNKQAPTPTSASSPKQDFDFIRKPPSIGNFGMAETLDLSRPKPRVQSSRLDEYVKKYSGGEGFEPPLQFRGSEPGGYDGGMLGRGEREATSSSIYGGMGGGYGARDNAGLQRDPAALGILKYKNF